MERESLHNFCIKFATKTVLCYYRGNFLFKFYFLRYITGSWSLHSSINVSARHVWFRSIEAPGFFEQRLCFVSIFGTPGSHSQASKDIELKDHTDVAVIEIFQGQQGKKMTWASRAVQPEHANSLALSAIPLTCFYDLAGEGAFRDRCHC